jgi:hypothetical protein
MVAMFRFQVAPVAPIRTFRNGQSVAEQSGFIHSNLPTNKKYRLSTGL